MLYLQEEMEREREREAEVERRRRAEAARKTAARQQQQQPPPRRSDDDLEIVDFELDDMLVQLETDDDFQRLSDNEKMAWLESLFYLDTGGGGGGGNKRRNLTHVSSPQQGKNNLKINSSQQPPAAAAEASSPPSSASAAKVPRPSSMTGQRPSAAAAAAAKEEESRNVKPSQVSGISVAMTLMFEKIYFCRIQMGKSGGGGESLPSSSSQGTVGVNENLISLAQSFFAPPSSSSSSNRPVQPVKPTPQVNQMGPRPFGAKDVGFKPSTAVAPTPRY